MSIPNLYPLLLICNLLSSISSPSPIHSLLPIPTTIRDQPHTTHPRLPIPWHHTTQPDNHSPLWNGYSTTRINQNIDRCLIAQPSHIPENLTSAVKYSSPPHGGSWGLCLGPAQLSRVLRSGRCSYRLTSANALDTRSDPRHLIYQPHRGRKWASSYHSRQRIPKHRKIIICGSPTICFAPMDNSNPS